jgi:hypothetical protein
MGLCHRHLGIVVAACIALTGCGRDSATSATPAASAPSAAGASAPAFASSEGMKAATGMPDVGKVDAVMVRSQGQGATPAEAVDDAVRSAILQTNGVSLDLKTSRYAAALHLAAGRDMVALQSEGFAQELLQRAGGTITSFKVLSLKESPAPQATPASAAKTANAPAAPALYKAEIEAAVARYQAPQDAGKIRLVVGPIRADSASFVVGGIRVPAEQVIATLRERLLTALVNTGRFVVLDRDGGDDIDRELEMIAAGRSPSVDNARLGQAVVADVIWTGRINRFAYDTHVRQLETSDRPLVSHSGGWSISQKLLNVATRQVMLTDTLQAQLPSTAPTTLGANVDNARVLEDMQSELTAQAVASVLQRTFPISVASREGNGVVLSQGGQSLREGLRYEVVVLGQDIRDPQTGQSLGRTESHCCEVVIDKVMPTMSYGHLEAVAINLDTAPAGALQLRQAVLASRAPVPAPTQDVGVTPKKPQAIKPSAKSKTVEAKPAANEEKW